MNRYDGRVAAVTGAASGIGRATAVRLASEGAAVACIDVDEAGLAETLHLIDGAAGAHVLDVTNEHDVVATLDAIVAEHGRLDCLIAMAGIISCQHSHQVTLDEWNRVLGVNLTGTFLVVREAIPHLLETKGAIVLAASTSSLSGHPWMLPYAASKGAILAMTYTLAVEYARRGLRINAVAPGGITTPMTANFAFPEGADLSLLERISPVDDFRGPETVAATIAFLASDDAVHVNGEYVRVDGATLA